jgi:CHASE3 domain sensor protein
LNKPLLLQFNQWKIGTRLGAGFCTVLFLFILVSMLSWGSRNDNQRTFVLYSQASTTATAILEVNHQITDLKSAILAYSQTGHKAAMVRIKGLYVNVQESLAAIRPAFTDAERHSILV